MSQCFYFRTSTSDKNSWRRKNGACPENWRITGFSLYSSLHGISTSAFQKLRLIWCTANKKASVIQPSCHKQLKLILKYLQWRFSYLPCEKLPQPPFQVPLRDLFCLNLFILSWSLPGHLNISNLTPKQTQTNKQQQQNTNRKTHPHIKKTFPAPSKNIYPNSSLSQLPRWTA